MEEDKGGHGLDADLGGDLLLSVDVDLEEADLLTGGGVGDLLEDGTDNPAGTAPGGPEVDDDGLVTVNLLGGEMIKIQGRVLQMHANASDAIHNESIKIVSQHANNSAVRIRSASSAGESKGLLTRVLNSS